MLARRFKCRNQRWEYLYQSLKHSIRLYSGECSSFRGSIVGDAYVRSNYVRQHMLECGRTTGVVGNSLPLSGGLHSPWRGGHLRFYSSEGGRGNARDEEHISVKDGVDFDKNGVPRTEVKEAIQQFDQHARLGEQDQKEWLSNEKLAIENKKKESPFLSRQEKFKNEFMRRIVPWEKITVSWDTFPYYVHEHTKSLLVDCASSHLNNKKFTSEYGSRLPSSSGRILLQSVPGTELYRERLVRALARDLKVPLLVLDSSVLAPYDFGDDGVSENDSDDEHAVSSEECTSGSEGEDENEEEWANNAEAKSDASEDDEADVQASAEALKKLVPFNLDEFEKRVSGECESASESSKSVNPTADESQRPLRKGDRIKYIGRSVHVESDSRILLGKIPTSDGPMNAYTIIRSREIPTGQCGEVYEVEKDRVAVILDRGEKDGNAEQDVKPPIYWIPVKDIERDLDAQAEDCYIAMESLCEVLQSQQPLIVYFPDSSLWLSRAAPKSNRTEFVSKVGEMFDRLSGPLVLICGQNKVETGSKEKEKFTMLLPNFGRLAKLEEELLRTFNKQLEEDRRIVISRSNLNELHKVLEEHELSCLELLQVGTDGVLPLTLSTEAEKVVGWAKNHYLASCLIPSVKGERLTLPRESLEVAISRLKEQESITKKPSQNLKNLAKDEYESNFITAVVPPGEVGVQFDDIGALEDVKKALNELVILPMRRPELFSRGNLLRPCKGILLFGPPGTGKTLLAKALATEAGANFISVTGSTLTSKWFGDAEKLTKALFSFASKLAPVIIFVDEVDSLLGARGGSFEHEATRRMRNEFMAAWDGLRTKDSQRILILGATNRPFDLDDAVIRRLPRRIYVDLPDVENRMKILKIFLAQENIEPNFQFDKLANVTEGYSGSDLKNLCIAAAYRPVQELLEQENKFTGNSEEFLFGVVELSLKYVKGWVEKNVTSSILRPLSLEDFIQSKSKVGPSVAYDAASMNELRKWNDQYGEGGSRKKSPFGF
uniref:AAA+ ATPase domain-containing protein n=1 Tax=Chenopodium quinoa TaxID=63459 RepID=A0A803LRX4_CHEQI